MKYRKWRSAKSKGNDLENEVKHLLNLAGIPYEQESTMGEHGRRVSGSVDFIIKNPEGYIECKRYTKSITFKVNSNQHDIKWNQICFLSQRRSSESGFIFQETNDKGLYYMNITKFLEVWANSNKSSMNLGDIKEHGTLIEDFKWLIKEA